MAKETKCRSCGGSGERKNPQWWQGARCDVCQGTGKTVQNLNTLIKVNGRKV